MEKLEYILENRKIRYGHLSDSKKRTYFKSMTSKANAIKAFCTECLGYTNRNEDIRDCCGFGCPFYFLRPYQYDNTQGIISEIEKTEEKYLPELNEYQKTLVGESVKRRCNSDNLNVSDKIGS